MLTALLACVLSAPCAAPFPPPPTARVAQDLDAQIAAAGKDVAKLLAMAAASTNDEVAKKVYKRVLEIDPANEAAHKGLRHQLYDGKWFESFTELSKYKREEAARMKAKGLARFQDQWVPEGELRFLNMGWTKDAEGAWRSPLELARKKQEDEAKGAGKQFRADDNSWIDAADVGKWQSMQWKCGDAWVDLAKANEYHAKIETAWELASEHFLVTTTCPWETGNLARWHAEKAYAELVRLFGVAPRSRLEIVVLNGLEQYNKVAGGQPLLPEAEGFSSLHGAYFSDFLFDNSTKPPQFAGCGVSYWDMQDTKLASWGPLWARWAAAQSFVDALDPSWNTIGEWAAGGGKTDMAVFANSFWAEKKLPRWLRYGAAAYVERFLKDPLAQPEADPWALRAFAFAGLKKAGGLRRLDDVFAFKLDLKDIPGSGRLYQEAGLLVAWMLDGSGGDKEVAKALQGLRDALKSGKGPEVSTAAMTLQKTLAKHERDIKKFAGL